MWVNKWFWGDQFSSVNDDKNTCVNKLMLHFTSRGFFYYLKKVWGGKRASSQADLTHSDVTGGMGRGLSQGRLPGGANIFLNNVLLIQ